MECWANLNNSASETMDVVADCAEERMTLGRMSERLSATNPALDPGNVRST